MIRACMDPKDGDIIIFTRRVFCLVQSVDQVPKTKMVGSHGNDKSV